MLRDAISMHSHSMRAALTSSVNVLAVIQVQMTIDAAEHSQLVLRHVRGAQRTARNVEHVLVRIPHPDPVDLPVAAHAEGGTRSERG